MTLRKGGAQPMSREEAQQRIEIVEECLSEGFPMRAVGASPSAISEGAKRAGVTSQSFRHSIHQAELRYGLKPDEGLFVQKRPQVQFTVEDLPDDGEPDAEELIAILTARHAKRKAVEDAAKLRNIHVHIDGPVGVAFFGDPHVDDPGCAWGDLERDVRLCRDTAGLFAVDVGDDSNNWVGRLMKLYANQEVTSKQSLKLIEWLMTSIPWLLRIKGNHDEWNGEKGDVADYIHRLGGSIGALEGSGARVQLNLPTGAQVRMHVRHDFPGGSQFNPAHAMVRETLFGHRDHIMACGHRHTSGYIPVWHNDPRRLCHGFRVGTYKDFDKYAKEKGFQDGNWARSMAAVIDPAFAHDPVRYIRPFFSLEEAAEYLNWKRAKHATGRAAA
jgi:hypothetical protein